MSKSIKNILLTGSGGFIGKNLKSYLQGKYDLLCPRSVELDLCDCTAVKKYFTDNDIDFIIHGAAIGGVRGVQDKDTTVDDNLAMVDNLLNAKREDVRVILFGSGAMYDKSRNLHKVKEEEIGKFEPKDLYGKSKLLIAEKIKNRKDVLCLNIFGCYGKYEKDSRFPTYAIKQNLDKKAIEINQNVVFDYLFVEDMERIIEYFIENVPQDNIINVTPTISISLLEIAGIINEISDYKSEIKIKNSEMNNEYTGDNSLLLKNFSSLQFTDMHEGLRKLYQYIK